MRHHDKGHSIITIMVNSYWRKSADNDNTDYNDGYKMIQIWQRFSVIFRQALDLVQENTIVCVQGKRRYDLTLKSKHILLELLVFLHHNEKRFIKHPFRLFQCHFHKMTLIFAILPRSTSVVHYTNLIWTIFLFSYYN